MIILCSYYSLSAIFWSFDRRAPHSSLWQCNSILDPPPLCPQPSLSLLSPHRLPQCFPAPQGPSPPPTPTEDPRHSLFTNDSGVIVSRTDCNWAMMDCVVIDRSVVGEICWSVIHGNPVYFFWLFWRGTRILVLKINNSLFFLSCFALRLLFTMSSWFIPHAS